MRGRDSAIIKLDWIFRDRLRTISKEQFEGHVNVFHLRQLSLPLVAILEKVLVLGDKRVNGIQSADVSAEDEGEGTTSS